MFGAVTNDGEGKHPPNTAIQTASPKAPLPRQIDVRYPTMTAPQATVNITRPLNLVCSNMTLAITSHSQDRLYHCLSPRVNDHGSWKGTLPRSRIRSPAARCHPRS